MPWLIFQTGYGRSAYWSWRAWRGPGGPGGGRGVLQTSPRCRFGVVAIGPGVAEGEKGREVETEPAFEDGSGLRQGMIGAVTLRVGEGDEVDDVGAIAEELAGALLCGGGLEDQSCGAGLCHRLVAAWVGGGGAGPGAGWEALRG